MRVVFSLLSLVSAVAFSQEMSLPAGAENQCRVQAKEIAIKTYQTCVTETRSAKIEQIRQEYQEKLVALKNEYDAQLKELSGAVASTQLAVDPVETQTEAIPTVIEPVTKEEPALKQETVTQENLTLTEPTITLKPAAATTAPVTKAKKQVKKSAKKAAPIVAKKRAKGEKGVKGIAKTLPAKQKVVETKPASNVTTKTEIVKVAPIQESELEKAVITKAPLNQNEEQLQVVDPTLGAHASETESTQQ